MIERFPTVAAFERGLASASELDQLADYVAGGRYFAGAARRLRGLFAARRTRMGMPAPFLRTAPPEALLLFYPPNCGSRFD